MPHSAPSLLWRCVMGFVAAVPPLGESCGKTTEDTRTLKAAISGFHCVVAFSWGACEVRVRYNALLSVSYSALRMSGWERRMLSLAVPERGLDRHNVQRTSAGVIPVVA